ncbi:MAG: polyprenyl synthetase family protein [Pseudomonadota bacterium]
MGTKGAKVASAQPAVSPTRAKPGADNALVRLSRMLEGDMARVNETIIARMDSPVALIPQLAGYLVAAGGKRLRPLLTLASARLCGYTGDHHISLAAAVEFIHTATLLHDDVVDDSDLRRGQSSANMMFGNEASVLVGDFLFARSFQLMVETGSPEVLRILANASAIIAEGEVLQLSAANDLGTDEDLYLRVIEAKTAALFEAATQVGAVIADEPADIVDALRRYGHNLGIAFQLVDDVLDYSAAQAQLGKSIGDDFREGKVTLPVVLAYAQGSERERAFWQRTLEEQKVEDGDLDEAQDILTRHAALDQAIARARDYGDRARQALNDGAPASPMRETMSELVDFCVEREY